jgi:glycosyltransferase involved in cell wall biosynthesis
MLRKNSLEDKTLVSIVTPVYNEESVIAQFIDRVNKVMEKLQKYNFELIIVDDGSRDRSVEITKKIALKDNRIRIVELMRNYGQTAALSAGIDLAKGDIVITLDSDLQHFPEEIPLFLEKIEEGYDLVCGWRRERKEGIIRRWPSRIANYILHKISKVDIHDFGTTFRAYRKEILKEIELFGEMHRFIPALASRLGCKIAEIPIQNISRPVGKSNYSISRAYGVALDLFFLFFYLNYLTKPIRIFGLLAISLFGFGFVIALSLVVLTYMGIIGGVRERIGMLLLSIFLMLLGVNSLFYGLIAEVQNRIYFEVKRYKIYNIKKIWGKKDKESFDIKN